MLRVQPLKNVLVTKSRTNPATNVIEALAALHVHGIQKKILIPLGVAFRIGGISAHCIAITASLLTVERWSRRRLT